MEDSIRCQLAGLRRPNWRERIAIWVVIGYLKEMIMLNGMKTYIAAAGLFALGVYQLTQGEFEAAMKSFTEALAVFGLRAAVGKATI